MSMKVTSTGTMIARSALMHGAAIIAVAVAAPEIKSMPEGTKPVTVEIIHKNEAPKGRQVKTMKPTPLVQTPVKQQMVPAKKIKAPMAEAPIIRKIAVPKVQPMKARKISVAKPAPKKARSKAVAVAAVSGKRMKDLDGDIPTPVKNDVDEKLKQELAALKDQMRRAELNKIAKAEKEAQEKDEQKRAVQEALKVALAEERARNEAALAKRDVEQKAAIAAALVAQQEAAGAQSKALEERLAKQRLAQEAALAKAQKQIQGQGQALNSLKEKNVQLATVNQDMAKQMRDNLAFGLPSGTRDVRNLRQVAGNVPPQYSRQARLKKQQGKVLLHYYVTPQGRVTGVKVVKSTGYQDLDREAARAIGQYRFYPGQQGSTKHMVNFSLTGAAQSLSGGLRTR